MTDEGDPFADAELVRQSLEYRELRTVTGHHEPDARHTIDQ